MYDVLEVCRHIVNYCNDHDYSITNLKLQKILYFIQADFLVSTSQKCFNDRIEAWDFGPVVPKAYRAYKQFGNSYIPKVTYYVEKNDSDFWSSKVKQYTDTVITEPDKKRIDEIVDALSGYSATELVKITHQQKPWINAFSSQNNKEITTGAIEEYFKNG